MAFTPASSQCFPELLISSPCPLGAIPLHPQARLPGLSKLSMTEGFSIMSLAPHLIHGGLFLICPLAEILKFRHLTFHPVGEALLSFSSLGSFFFLKILFLLSAAGACSVSPLRLPAHLLPSLRPQQPLSSILPGSGLRVCSVPASCSVF